MLVEEAWHAAPEPAAESAATVVPHTFAARQIGTCTFAATPFNTFTGMLFLLITSLMVRLLRTLRTSTFTSPDCWPAAGADIRIALAPSAAVIRILRITFSPFFGSRQGRMHPFLPV